MCVLWTSPVFPPVGIQAVTLPSNMEVQRGPFQEESRLSTGAFLHSTMLAGGGASRISTLWCPAFPPSWRGTGGQSAGARGAGGELSHRRGWKEAGEVRRAE